MVDPEKVQEIWTNIQDKGDPELDEEEIEEIPREGEELKPGQKNEAWIFQESCMRQRDAVEGFWTKKGTEIREVYNAKSPEEKRAILSDARNIISQMGNGTYQNALMYCPELNPSKLSGIDTKPAPFCLFSLDDLVEFVRKQKELPKITAKNHDEIIAAIKSSNYGDHFIATIIKKLGASQKKLLPLVAISRQHLLFIYCHLVFLIILGLPISIITTNVPGCTDESDSVADSLNVPFSTREQREATPIGKPPIPNILKRKQERETEETSSGESKKEEISSNSSSVLCSESTCRKKQKENEKFQVCSFCKKFQKSVPYCSKECQIQHWRSGHKKECEKK